MGTLISLFTLALVIYQAVNLKDIGEIIKKTKDINKKLDELDKEEAPD